MGKKNKKNKKQKEADLDDYPEDLDDLDPLKGSGPGVGGGAEDLEEEEEAVEQPAKPFQAGKKKGKKGKKGKKQQAKFESDSDDDLDPLKAAAKGGGSGGFDALEAGSGDDEDSDKQETSEEEEEEEEEEVSFKPRGAAAGFAALMGDDEDDEDDEEEESDDEPMVSQKQTSGFAALMGDDEDEEEEEEEEEEEPVVAKPSGFAALMFQAGGGSDTDTESESESESDGEVPPITGKVLSTEDHPNADKLKVCEIDAGDRTYQIVTSAKNVKKGRRVALARPGCVAWGTKVKVEKCEMRGVESEGMVLSTFDLGWEDEKSKKAAILPKKWKAGHAVPREMPEEMKEEGGVDLSVFDTGKKKKKSKKDKPTKAEDAGESGEGEVDLSVFAKKKKSKSKKDKEPKSADAELKMAELSLAEKEEEAPAAEEEEGGGAPSFDASAFAAKGSKKKNKKKKKAAAPKPAADDLDDIDAILAELDGPSAPAKAEEPAPEPAPAKEEEPAPEVLAEDAGGEPKALTANQKKKLKKKQKEAERKAKLAAEGGEAEDSPAKGKKVKGGKPVSAAVRKMQEELEERKRMEEEQRRLEEEQRRLEEEEEARLAEEERQKEEKRRLKKEKERLKKEKARKEGKLLTGKAKEEARRLAAMREQMLRQAGIEPDSPEPEGKKKRVVYEKRKKGPTAAEKKAAEEAAAAKAVEEKRAKEAALAKAKEEAARAEETLEEEEPAGDWDEVDWESKAGEKSSSTSWVDVKGEEKDDDSDEYSESDLDSDEELERRIDAARAKRHERYQAALKNRSKDHLRSPICCILGHVDTGKTKLLDKIRGTNVQDGEAGGITQQIGATYIPGPEIVTRTKCLGEEQVEKMNVPGLLVIDTPGHESFTNLRSRGSGLCDIAILVVDIMHGLEQQTIESLNMLKMRKTPFIIALNKCDRMYDWKAIPNGGFRETLASQGEHVQQEFKKRYDDAVLALNTEGMNVALYWENPDIKSYVSIVPTSAITGEGVPDILNLLVQLTQNMMVERLMHTEFLQCTVLEVKQIEGLGTTIDVILINGTLRDTDTIVVCGLGGPIVTNVRALLTPHPMKEMRVKGDYLHHKEIEAAQGVKICANDLEGALAGTPLFVLGPEDDEEDLKDEVVSDVQSILGQVDKSGEGVCVQASTLGSLEALLEFLKSPDVKIPVSGISIGPVHKKDVMKASIMLERKKEFAVILAFDVDVSREARDMANELGIKIFTADIIYHLFDQFTAYMKKVKEDRKKEVEMDATFPCVLKILPTCIFNKKDPIVLGVEVLAGIAKVGSPLCVPTQDFVEIGRIASLEKNHKPVDKAYVGDSVAMKVNSTTALEASRMYGRHFDHTDELVSRISRHSINLLKENYRDDLTKEDWQLVLKLKHLFQIQ